MFITKVTLHGICFSKYFSFLYCVYCIHRKKSLKLIRNLENLNHPNAMRNSPIQFKKSGQ